MSQPDFTKPDPDRPSGASVPGFQQEIVYFFRSGRHGLIRKTVVFFLAEVAKTDVILSEEHVGYEFLSYEQAVKRATFAAAKQLLRAAHECLTAVAQQVHARGPSFPRRFFARGSAKSTVRKL